MKNENRDGLLKSLFTLIGALVSICAVIALAYVLFKKYFQVTFECDEGDGGIAEEDDPFADDEDRAFEPICCCDEEETPEEDEPHACGCAEEPEKAAE
ncbi:MAG: hypothetical protein E7576_11695 [Ruminococcaceae bacterium]|nr:hypothetical protein [Oscillospiraceae bacterium]